MFKKMSTLGLVFLLTFYPVAAFAAETNETDPNDSIVETEIDENAHSEDKSEEAEQNGETTESSEEVSLEDDVTEEENTSDAEEETEKAEPTATEEEARAAENDEVEEDLEGTEPLADEVEEEEEELNLTDVFGNISGGIEYDFNKGYYVLKLRAGITNFHTQQEIKNKWVGFTLPNGVYVPELDGIPSGVVPIGIAGKSGLAIKIPDVNASGSETVTLDIPLAGVEDDNDPHLNTYLLGVDVNAGSYEEVGQLRGQRDIDFSVMTDPAELDLHGSISGETVYDEEKGFHFLDVTVKAKNQTNDNVNDVYVGLDLPEDVAVISNEFSPSDVELINKDGGKTVALKLPELTTDAEKEVTYRIPVVGVSDAIVESDNITAYRFIDGLYDVVGEFGGNINVDFSNMEVEWKFEAENEIIKDYPNLGANEFGFRFNYEIKNIDLDNVDKVKLEFNVPSDITILEPVYNDSLGDVVIDWDGNTANVILGDLTGASGYKGYFTAIGTSNKSLEQLKDLEVTVTLYRDGEEIVETITAPFVFGTYDDDGFTEDPDTDDPDETDDSGNEDNNNNSDDTDNSGSGSNNNSDGNTNDNTNTDGNTNNENTDSTSDNSNGDVTITVEDGDDSESSVAGSSSNNNTSGGLPNTATNHYSILLLGSIILVAGSSLLLFRKKSVPN